MKESKGSEEGFYCNLNTILSSYDLRQIAILIYNDQVIGFATWDINSIQIACIQIMEIKPVHRGKGYGEWFILRLFDYFIATGIVVVDVQCKPETSNPFWKKLGFIEFPSSYYLPSTDKWLYRPLVPILTPIRDEKNEPDQSIKLFVVL